MRFNAFFTQCVCPAWAGIERYQIIPEDERSSCAPMANRGSISKSQGGLTVRVCTEGSETANPGSNEQELNKRLFKADEVAHHTNVQRKQQVFTSRFQWILGEGMCPLPREVLE